MRTFTLAVVFILFTSSLALANGVCIEDAETGVCLELVNSDVVVVVENQVAIVTTTQTFRNNLSYPFTLKYAFPLYEDASSTSLQWEIEGTWYEAIVSATDPDTIPGGSNMEPDLQEYLGDTPLYFADDNYIIQTDGLFQVKLTYVQLLPYLFGYVDFHYPNDYTLVQSASLDYQILNFELNSFRTIETFDLLSHTASSISNNGYQAEISYEEYESQADMDYHIQYSLSLNELGLFSMSTFLDAAQVPDEHGNGFFTFIAEPEPDTSIVIQKVFTLIIDRSGSMSGQKIVQARNASTFIVNNLNEGDKFNLVDFSSTVSSFSNEHVEFTSTTQSQALQYISGLYAGGSTNISGAFNLAVPQFSTATDSTANIIIFFTDGLPTAGITSMWPLLEFINNLILDTETAINLFTFGIGSDVDTQFLSLLAAQNNGLSTFLGNDELEEVITQFYLMIRNPVLINTSISFDPPNTVSECYPEPLPNLYQGIQMIVSGRYSEGCTVTVNLDGEQFGNPVHYEYEMELVDSTVTDYQFLTKLWAIAKIEHLLVEYYSLNPGSPEAEAIKAEIIEISVAYGVLSPFTSFTGPGVGIEEGFEWHANGIVADQYELLGNFPNPFNPSTTIRFQVHSDLHKVVMVKIYNIQGQVVRVMAVNVTGAGLYEIVWDGITMEGQPASGGIYIYTINFGDGILSSTMVMMK